MNVTSNKLFNKDFTLVLIGQIISLFGNAILRFALPLHLLRETGSATLFGLVSATSLIPMIVFSVFGGVLADRVNKRSIMVVLDFVTALVIIIFYLALGQLPIVPLIIVTLMLLYGIDGMYRPAVRSSIPVLLSNDKMMAGNSMITMVGTLSGLLGPAIGGMIYGGFGLVAILSISIICFIFSAIMEIFIKIPHSKQNNEKGAFLIVKDDLKEAFVFVKTEKPIFLNIIAIICAVNMIFSAAMSIGMPVIIIEVLNLSDTLLGFHLGSFALGGLVGGLITAVLARKIKLQNSYVTLGFLAITASLMGITLLFSTSSVMTYSILTAMGFISMVSSTTFSIQMMTTLQRQTPPHLIGKVMGVMMSLSLCALPIGMVLFGWLFDVFINNSGFILLGVALVILVLSIYSKSVFKRIKE